MSAYSSDLDLDVTDAGGEAVEVDVAVNLLRVAGQGRRIAEARGEQAAGDVGR